MMFCAEICAHGNHPAEAVLQSRDSCNVTARIGDGMNMCWMFRAFYCFAFLGLIIFYR